MAFRDLDEFLVVEPFVLPIRGKKYKFPGQISAKAGLRLRLLGGQMEEGDPESEALSDAEEASLRTEMFGGVEEQMVEDGLTPEHLRVVFYTLIAFHMDGIDTALQVWNAQAKAPAPNRATRRSKVPAKSTRSRGSHVGSTAPKAAAAKPAPGPASSKTGS